MVTIAPAAHADVPQLAELLAVLFEQEADFSPDRPKQERGLGLLIDSPQLGVIFVAREAEEIIGMVSLLFTISTAEGAPACWLEDMVVRPDRRGDGIGSRLLGHAIDHARALGYARITLLTDKLNAGAIGFYRRHGFAESPMMALRLALTDPAGDAS